MICRRDRIRHPIPPLLRLRLGHLSVGDCQMTANTLKITCPKCKKENAIPFRQDEGQTEIKHVCSCGQVLKLNPSDFRGGPFKTLLEMFKRPFSRRS
jgi:phage FluMu protein Com